MTLGGLNLVSSVAVGHRRAAGLEALLGHGAVHRLKAADDGKEAGIPLSSFRRLRPLFRENRHDESSSAGNDLQTT